MFISKDWRPFAPMEYRTMRQGDVGTYVSSGGFKWLGKAVLPVRVGEPRMGPRELLPSPPLESLLAEGILLWVILNFLMGLERLGQTYTLALTPTTLILNWRPNKIHLQIYGKQHWAWIRAPEKKGNTLSVNFSNLKSERQETGLVP